MTVLASLLAPETAMAATSLTISNVVLNACSGTAYSVSFDATYELQGDDTVFYETTRPDDTYSDNASGLNSIPSPQPGWLVGFSFAAQTYPYTSSFRYYIAAADGSNERASTTVEVTCSGLNAGTATILAAIERENDGDDDGVPDGSDNCELTPNADQADADGNGVGDACDGDYYAERISWELPLVTKGGPAASASDPVVIQVAAAASGVVSILERDPGSRSLGTSAELGPRADITIPSGGGLTVIRFRLDPTIVPPSVGLEALGVLHDGEPVGPCTDAGAPAPDPCVAGRELAAGDLAITVHTTRASEWGFAIPADGCGEVATVFPDLVGNTHARAVACLEAWGLVAGSGDLFDAGSSVSRGQMASLVSSLLAALGERPTGSDAFPDDDGTTHEGSIDQLAGLGIYTGVDGAARADDAISRADAAAVVVRTYEHLLGSAPAGAAAFPDVGPDAAASIGAAAELGLVRGYTDGTFGPGDPLRRDHAAEILYRLLERLLADGAW